VSSGEIAIGYVYLHPVMRKRKERLPVLENVIIESIAAEGKCIAHYEDMVVFVEGIVAPGDVADLQVTRKKKNFMEAVPVRFHQLSPMRAIPFCQHFGVCGGCKWQHIPYQTQLEYKQQQVIDNLERIAKVPLPPVRMILPSRETTYYRNKLEFTFSPNRWLTDEELRSQEKLEKRTLGFHIPKRFDKILDIEHCYLQPEPSNPMRLEVKNYARTHNLSFFDNVKNEGLLRNLVIRTASTGEIMVILQVYYADQKQTEDLLSYLHQKFPQITSLQYVINPKGNDTFHDLEVICFKGKPYITEQMEGLHFRIGPKSFYQTNTQQAYELYKITREFANLQGNEVVYDLYTGTGTIANFVARRARKVVGLEYIATAIEDAKINSNINNIGNTAFFAGDIKHLLTKQFIENHGKPDVVITDPPRAGMDPQVIEMLLLAAPEKIVYVSCNPATQARDLALLDANYSVQAVQPVDMFPHTYHVENVALLVRK
jgi:23S rRNA (uracil1939-C5)-methyltransferase